MREQCIFCSIIDGRSPGKILYQDADLVVLEDIAPQAPHHYLIVPREHIPTVMDMNDAPDDLAGKIFRTAARIAREMGFADRGFRVVSNCNRDGGQTVWHLHFHLLGGRTFDWPPG
jgi:histidine triad (HIT) family protein